MDETLNYLVDKLRQMVGDPAGAKEVFDRDAIEGFLSDNFFSANGYMLEYAGSRAFSLLTNWSTDTVLTDPNGNELTPDEIDLLRGSWVFNTAQPYPIYVAGRTYDLHAAAADLLEAWAARIKLEHNLSIGDLKLDRNQKYTSLMDLAKYHRKKQRILSVRVPDDSFL